MSGNPWICRTYNIYEAYNQTRREFESLLETIAKLEESTKSDLSNDSDLEPFKVSGRLNSRVYRRECEALKVRWRSLQRLSRTEKDRFVATVNSTYPESTIGLPGDNIKQKVSKTFTADLTGYSGAVAELAFDTQKSGFLRQNPTLGYSFFIEKWAMEQVSEPARKRLEQLVEELRITENKKRGGRDSFLIGEIEGILTNEGVVSQRELDAKSKGIMRTFFYSVVREPFYTSPETRDRLEEAAKVIYRAFASAALAQDPINFNVLNNIPSPLIATNSADFMPMKDKLYLTDVAPKAMGSVIDPFAIGRSSGRAVETGARREANAIATYADKVCIVAPDLEAYQFEARVLINELQKLGIEAKMSDKPSKGFYNISTLVVEQMLAQGSEIVPDIGYTRYASLPIYRNEVLRKIEPDLNQLGVLLPRRERVQDILSKLNIQQQTTGEDMNIIGMLKFVRYLQEVYGQMVVIRNENERGSGSLKTKPVNIYDLELVRSAFRKVSQILIEECIPPWIRANGSDYSGEIRVYGAVVKK